MANDVELFGYPTSPYVQKIKCVLDYKQVAYRFVPVAPVAKTELAFTGDAEGTTVPVLKIGEDWKADSTPIARWLDEVFPGQPVTGEHPDEQDIIAEHDDWVTRSLIPSWFRSAASSSNPYRWLRDGWRLGSIVHSSSPIPLSWRLSWPYALSIAPFIKEIIAASDLDPDQSVPAMRAQMVEEFAGRLADGPYLGGRNAPSLADLAAFPLFWFNYSVGMAGPFPQTKHKDIRAWAQRMSGHLPENPFPVADRFIVRALPN